MAKNEGHGRWSSDKKCRILLTNQPLLIPYTLQAHGSYSSPSKSNCRRNKNHSNIITLNWWESWYCKTLEASTTPCFLHFLPTASHFLLNITFLINSALPKGLTPYESSNPILCSKVLNVKGDNSYSSCVPKSSNAFSSFRLAVNHPPLPVA